MWLEPTAATALQRVGRGATLPRFDLPQTPPLPQSTPALSRQITHESLGRDLLLMFVGLLVLDPRASFQVGKFKMAPGCKTDARKPTIAYIRTHLARNRNNGNTGRSS